MSKDLPYGAESLEELANNPQEYLKAVANVNYMINTYGDLQDPLLQTIKDNGWFDDAFNTTAPHKFFYSFSNQNFVPLKNVEAAKAVGLDNNAILNTYYNRYLDSEGVGLLSYVKPQRRGAGKRLAYIYDRDCLFRLYIYFYLFKHCNYAHVDLLQLIGSNIDQSNEEVIRKTSNPAGSSDKAITAISKLEASQIVILNTLSNIVQTIEQFNEISEFNNTLITNNRAEIETIVKNERTIRFNELLDKNKSLQQQLRDNHETGLRLLNEYDNTEKFNENAKKQIEQLTEELIKVDSKGSSGGFLGLFKKTGDAETQKKFIKDHILSIEHSLEQLRPLDEIKKDIAVQNELKATLEEEVAKVEKDIRELNAASENLLPPLELKSLPKTNFKLTQLEEALNNTYIMPPVKGEDEFIDYEREYVEQNNTQNTVIDVLPNAEHRIIENNKITKSNEIVVEIIDSDENKPE